jgi:hypothetical protein
VKLPKQLHRNLKAFAVQSGMKLHSLVAIWLQDRLDSQKAQSNAKKN